MGIVDSNGSLVVEYKYDVWDKPTLVCTLTTEYETLAKLNPFRYKGYIYDEEIGQYVSVFERPLILDGFWERQGDSNAQYSLLLLP